MLTTDTVPGRDALRFSGHETFAFRYAWLPKAYKAIRREADAFSDENLAIADLGLGKNMVRSLRFWADAVGLAVPTKTGLLLTDFAHEVFGEGGHDPFLEDVSTLWLLHWRLSSRADGGLFAWRHLLSHWPHPELTRSDALAVFVRESARLGHAHSSVTLSQHLDVFLHTYAPSRTAAGIEDSLDGPLVELALILKAGERRTANGRWETVYAFRREPKPDITPALFDWCLSDYWSRLRPNEQTLTLREVAMSPCSPGQVFKLTEEDVRERLETYTTQARRRPFLYQPSAVQGLLSRRQGAPDPTLSNVYEPVSTDA